MIVRISGLGQFELNDGGVKELNRLDTELTAALHARQEQEFHRLLAETIQYVRTNGAPVASQRVVPSHVIIPPEDITLDEAHKFFHDEGLLTPLPA